MFKSIEKEAEGIIVEKKSKFIANIYYVEGEEEAEEILNSIRKKYHDARHHCFAYRIYQDGRTISRQSDDGEPSGTAGAPMLNILEKQELANVLIIVTRYFGGILLGTGGLVKAYSDASKEAIENSDIVEKEEGYEIEVTLGYENSADFEHFCTQNGMNIIKKEFTDKIKFIVEISKEKYKKKEEKNLIINYQNLPVKILKNKFITINGKNWKIKALATFTATKKGEKCCTKNQKNNKKILLIFILGIIIPK